MRIEAIDAILAMLKIEPNFGESFVSDFNELVRWSVRVETLQELLSSMIIPEGHLLRVITSLRAIRNESAHLTANGFLSEEFLATLKID